MRIVLVTTATVPGGVWRHVLDLAEGLAARGHDVQVGARARSRGLGEAARDRGVRMLPLARALLERADVWHLHLHDTYDSAALPLLLARRSLRGGAIVLTEHLPRSNASDSSLLPGDRRPGAAAAKLVLKRAHARLAARIVVPSHGAAAFLDRRYGLSAPKVATVLHGVRADGDPDPPPPANGRLRVVSVGALGMQKGHDVLVEAAALARAPWTAVVVGDGAGRERLEARAAAVAGDRVSFAGWSGDVDAHLLAADCVCLPSRWESSSYAALEAMVRGRPVVASAVDGLEEIVADGRTGVLVPAGDAAALAAALDLLAADAGRCAELGRAARARVLGEFPLERMLDATLAVYREASRG